MLGDSRVRFCLGCEKDVYNLSAMAKADAEVLLRERLGNELCVRFYQRADGTLLTADCPVGVRKKRRKKLALAVAGAGAMVAAAAGMTVTTGRPNPRPVTVTYQSVEPTPTTGEMVRDVGDTNDAPPAPAQPLPHPGMVRMGRRIQHR